jgi:hypothetical protein
MFYGVEAGSEKEKIDEFFKASLKMIESLEYTKITSVTELTPIPQPLSCSTVLYINKDLKDKSVLTFDFFEDRQKDLESLINSEQPIDDGCRSVFYCKMSDAISYALSASHPPYLINMMLREFIEKIREMKKIYTPSSSTDGVI